MRLGEYDDDEDDDEPKEEVRKGHKVGDALEHAPGLEDKGGEGNAGQIHANSAVAG